MTALCFVTDGQGQLCVVSAAADKSLRVWHAGTGKCARTVAKRPSEISALAAGGCVAVGNLLPYYLRVRHGSECAPESLQPLSKAFEPLPRRPGCGVILAGDKGGGITVFPLADGSKPQRLTGCRLPAPVLSLAAAPCGAPLLVAGCADGSVHVVDWQAGAALRQLSRHSAEVQSVRWSTAGTLPPPLAAIDGLSLIHI